MLSVCIPVYDQPVAPLLGTLLEELLPLGQPFEILLADDGSPEVIQQRNAVESPADGHIRWLQPGRKMGRAALRNYLGRAAGYDWILFMDCDVLIENQSYIANYLKHFHEADVLVGGCRYQAERPAPDRLLRWTYGRQREVRPASQRNRQPYTCFSSFNCCIRKTTFEGCPFDESFHGYGHEDTLLGLQLQRQGARVLHIDNPLTHIGLTANRRYLSQSLAAVEKFLRLPVFRETDILSSVKILRWYRRCSRWGLRPLLSAVWSNAHGRMAKNLCGPRPGMAVFDLYRLSHLAYLDSVQPGESRRDAVGPLLSVIIPYYNREHSLQACLDSVADQSVSSLELILVDNASTDGSAALCRQFRQDCQSERFRVVLLSEPHRGACQARNTGLRAARGDYVLFFDSDDVMRQDYLQRLESVLSRPGAPELIACRCRTDRGQLLPKHRRLDPAQQLLDPVVMTHNVCLSRALLDRCGPWDEALERWQDLEFGFRLLRHARSHVWINKALYTVNTSADAISAPGWEADREKLLSSLDALWQDIEDMPESECLYPRTAWCFKLVSLAARIWREGARGQADRLYGQALAALPGSQIKYRPLLACHYGYTKRGGRGFWRIAALLPGFCR